MHTVEKVYPIPLMLWENHETEREEVCLKQYNLLVPEPEQKASVLPFPRAVNNYDAGDNSNSET